jgi:predicted Ser/Thr protein kinase
VDNFENIKLACINKNFKTKLGDFLIIKKLGKGKSGYSYLTEYDNKYFVLKLMHDEPCEYYSFGENNKVDLEVNAYHKLQKCGLTMPKLLFNDAEKNYLIKEFIDGITASELISKNQITELIIKQLFEMYHSVKDLQLNIDYFPTNFIIQNQKLYYIDYECNPYSSDWNLPNWGLYYWANSDGFKEYFFTGDIRVINESPDSGIPIKKPFEERVDAWKERYDIKTSIR